MIGKLKSVLKLSGGEWLISFTTGSTPNLEGLKDEQISVEIKKASRKRSLNANDFCWALCSDIGKAMTPPLTKETVYRQAIRAVGVYTPVRVVVWDVPKLLERWSSHGTGWFADIIDDSGIGRKLLHLYYGSSTYTVDEMRSLIDWLVDQAEQMQIPIPLSKAEQERMIGQWQKASCKKSGSVTSAAV